MIPVIAEGKEEYILIPLDVKDGYTIKVSGRGRHNSRTGQSGDLYVLVHVDDYTIPWKNILIAVLGGIVLACVLVRLLTGKTTQATIETEPTTDSVISVQVETTCSHIWLPVDCTAPEMCSKCGISRDSTSGHAWADATYNAPKTCTVCGKIEGEKKTPSVSMGLRDIVVNSSASSVYSGDNLGRHAPDKMYDGKLNTNWTEDASGNGVGEYVVFNFDDTYAVNKFSIYIGSHYNEAVYRQNCRPKAITLTFSDGSTELVRLNDSYDEQVITLKQYYYTEYIKLTIEEVYTGTKYLDTVIAELDFTAYRT